MDDLNVIQQCAKSKFINKFFALQNTIGPAITNSNLGFTVEITFRHHMFPDCKIVTTLHVSWDDIDRFTGFASNSH